MEEFPTIFLVLLDLGGDKMVQPGQTDQKLAINL
jgi:hypothetical protein